MTPRTHRPRWLASLAAVLLATTLPACAAPRPAVGDEAVVEAREALRKRDKVRLAALRSATAQAEHPLASWVDYWELNNRLSEARQPELDAFYTRWANTYVEDRLRNDWLLELGKRRDWENFRRDYALFRMNDDREVLCYALLTQHLAGQDVREPARNAWLAQRDLDDGCHLMATTLFEARRFKPDDAWQEARLSAEANRPRAVRAAVLLADPGAGAAIAGVLDDPARWLARPVGVSDPDSTGELALIALLRLAANDPEAAARQLETGWQRRLAAPLAAAAWAGVGRQAALKLSPQASEHYQRAWKLLGRRASDPPGWSDDTLAWQVRSALRSPLPDDERWALVQRGVEAMSAAEQRDATWVYWRARALQSRAAPGPEGDAARAAARLALESIAGQLNFYGKLATEDLGAQVALPPVPLPVSDAERQAARTQPGLARALRLIDIGLRNEGVREWNYSLRGLGDRELLAAAQWACEREVWDRCINTSDRTRGEVDMAQRFPMPFRADVLAKAREIGVDPAYMYGLIRQESRFIMDARSHVGASGLMQIMPATASWTARKIGMSDFKPGMVNERDVNLRLGASYLKLVLDDFGGSQAMAAAAYNAGPSRPRRWRDGALLEAAAWAENIPFNETRDYVKKVLSNAVYYGALLGAPTPSLKTRLGGHIGPRAAAAPTTDKEIP